MKVCRREPRNSSTATQRPPADRAPDLTRSPSIYFIDRPNRAAEAVIREVRGDRATVWLGGTVPDSLAEGITFVFDVVTSDGEEIGRAELISRDGLTGNVSIQRFPGVSSIPEGALLRETARRIPRDLKLRIGIDPSLGEAAIEAQQRLNDLPRTIALPFQDEETLYGGAIDYIFCRMTPDYLAAIDPDTEWVDVGSVGLLSQDLREIIPDSFSAPNESMELAVRRLNSKLRSLLAAKSIKQTLNANASTLNLAIALEIEGDTPSDSTASSQYRLLAQAFTVRGREEDSTVPRRAPTPMLRVGQHFNFAVVSQDSNPLYLLVLAISLEGIHFLFPRQPDRQEQLPLMKNGSLQIPARAPEPGISEVLFIASRTPMERARRAIATLEEERRLGQRQGQLAESEAIAALIDDLSDRRDGDSEEVPQVIRNREIAALSFTFEVVSESVS
ncbi:hypothetical protein POG22_08855 [Geitlerinema sp. CS-897]|nr:hypothetical protein [Geitlerinema sp. CS-897]